MVGLLKLMCVVMMAYGIYGIYRGEVWASGGMSGRMIVKEEESVSFWLAVGSYVIMSPVLIGVLEYKFGK